jgi:DNA-binding GntR family transcriptional regulator
MNAERSRRSLPTLHRKSNGEEAAIHIRRMIFDGELRPGERVPQDEIALALGISRIPLREALVALELQGWVTIELHRGAFVNAIDVQTVQDHFELLGVMYSWALERAMERGGEAFVERIVAIEQALRKEQDPDAASKLLFRVYSTMVEAARSSRLRIVLRATSSVVPGNFFEEVPGSIEIERTGLAAVVKALKAGDSARAAAELRKMLQRVCTSVVTLFHDRGLFAAPGAVAGS